MAFFVRACFPLLHLSNCCLSRYSTKAIKSPVFRKPSFSKTYSRSQNPVVTQLIENEREEHKQTSFEKMLEVRREEARRSILVQVHSDESCTELYSYCSHYGEVKSMHHYTLPESLHFVIVEFNLEAEAQKILHICGHIKKIESIPVRSPFVWFRNSSSSSSSSQKSLSMPLCVVNGDQPILDDVLKECLLQAESLSNQINILYKATSLSDLGSRLRFITARQIDLCLSSIFPHVCAVPFGSSVNGYGKAGCDLDLVLSLDPNLCEDDECRLVFHVRNSLANCRNQAQRQMEVIGDMCQLFLPGISHIRRIMQARVPIIKYKQDLTGVECDLSMSNITGISMSDLLYTLGSLDSRVRPLVFAVRFWAREVGLTNLSPGRWVTNYALTLMVLFFLQQGSTPILPTVNKMVELAGNRDRRVSPDGVVTSFIRDIPRLLQSVSNNRVESLETLLMEFFEFYSIFDFANNAISLQTGKVVTKPECSPLYIINPLERGLNVSKNVGLEEMEKIRIEFQSAAWLLEDGFQQPGRRDLPWGLCLFGSKGTKKQISPSRTKGKLVDFNELFTTDDAEISRNAGAMRKDRTVRRIISESNLKSSKAVSAKKR